MALKLPDWGMFIINSVFRFLFIRGGRGSAKSHTVARALLVIAKRRKTRILCTREFQNSIKESVHQLFKDLINDPGNDFTGFEVLENEIRHENGSEFYFKGLARQIDSIKSMEAIDYVWIEEGQTISKRSLDILIPTIRKEGSQIWVTYNPDLDEDPVHAMSLSGRQNMKVLDVNWNNNPFISKVLLDEKDEAYRDNPEKADNIWGGKTRKNKDQQVIKKWKVMAFEPDEDFGPAYQGVDFGFSQDPMTAVRLYVHKKEKKIYVRYAIGKKGILPTAMGTFLDIIPGFKKIGTKADNARPELVGHLKSEGYNIDSCKKWSGSVEDGIQWLQDYEIIVHPDCLKAHYAKKDEKYTIDDEFRSYSFKVDKRTGLISTDLEDKDNHYTDGMRYALEKFITKHKANWGSLYG